jgi:hypothetical protein
VQAVGFRLVRDRIRRHGMNSVLAAVKSTGRLPKLFCPVTPSSRPGIDAGRLNTGAPLAAVAYGSVIAREINAAIDWNASAADVRLCWLPQRVL